MKLLATLLVSMVAVARSAGAQVEVRATRAIEGGRPSVAADSMPRAIAEAEAQGARHPRAEVNNPLQNAPGMAPGSNERKCVSVDGFNAARSGDFVAGAFSGYDQAWRTGYGKVWWQPANATRDHAPPLIVRATRLGQGDATRVFEFPDITVPVGSNMLFYPSGTHVPTTGQWMLVATAGPNWGCFLLTVH